MSQATISQSAPRVTRPRRYDARQHRRRIGRGALRPILMLGGIVVVVVGRRLLLDDRRTQSSRSTTPMCGRRRR